MRVAGLSIRVPARAEELSGIRSRVAEYALAHGISREAVDDARTVVSEACANAIKYAYPGVLDGPLEVSASAEKGELRLVVRDFGAGVGFPDVPATPSLHAGFSILGALTTSFRLTSRRGDGTEIEARLPLVADA